MKTFKAIYNILRHPGNIFSLLRASVVYYIAKKEAMDKFRKTGRRYYCIYDPNSKRLVALTYKRYAGQYDSYQYLRFRGRIAPMTVKQFTDGAMYYTPSKNGAKEMTKRRQQERLDIMRRRYFMHTGKSERSSQS